MPQPPFPAEPEPEDSVPGALPVPDPDPEWERLVAQPDPMTAADREAWLDHLAELDEPADDEEDWWDPEGPPPGEDELTLEELAGIREVMEDQARAAAVAARLGEVGALAAIAASLGRRGPGQPGSAGPFPGESSSRAAAFGTGLALDVAAGCPELAAFADRAAGDGDRYEGVSDDELIGVLCAWDRVEAHAWARKLAAIAELIRRRPAAGCAPEGPARMPEAYEEFAADELAAVLAESRHRAEDLLTVALSVEAKLPGTKAALWDGLICRDKVQAIVAATALLDAAEARAAEEMVLGRAGRLTPGGLRAAIARAVMEVAPEKARKRREEAARDARVQRWAEDSGNAALMGRELPPADVLAADQRITAWARQLKAAGVEGCMDELRARAYLDLLLGKDSRPRRDAPGQEVGDQDSTPGADHRGPGGPADPDRGGDARGGPAGTRPGAAGPGGAGDTAPAPGGARAPSVPGGPVPGGPVPGGPVPGGPVPGGPVPGGPVSGGPVPGLIPAGFAGKITMTVPLVTTLDLADRPGEIPGIGPVDPWLARDLARAAAANPRTTWCVTVTDQHGHAVGHGCARPEPKSSGKQRRTAPLAGPDPPDPAGRTDGPGFAFTAVGDHGPPGGYGSWRLRVPGSGPDLIVALDPISTEACDHRFAADGHDPGVRLRHLSEVRHATCTGVGCRRPAAQCDFEHNVPYEAGGMTCLCNTGPKCRRDHRVKQDPRWQVDQLPDATFRWTTPSGRRYTTEPTRYPI